MTMVSDLPEPWVCQIIPPWRLPALPVFDAFHGGPDDKILLIASNLLDTAIKERELVGQLKQSFRAAEAVKRFVLLRD